MRLGRARGSAKRIIGRSARPPRLQTSPNSAPTASPTGP